MCAAAICARDSGDLTILRKRPIVTLAALWSFASAHARAAGLGFGCTLFESLAIRRLLMLRCWAESDFAFSIFFCFFSFENLWKVLLVKC